MALTLAASGTTFALDAYLARLTGLLGTTPRSWLERRHAEYVDAARRWVYARDHYSGDAASPEKIRYYLPRKALGEPLEAYEERVALADYTPHLGTIVDELAGMLFASDDDATRTYGSLGAPEVPGSPIGQLWPDADAAGNGWRTLWKLLALELTAIHRAWVFVDGGAPGDHPRVRVLPAEAGVNWRFAGRTLVEVLFVEEPVADAALDATAEPEEPAPRYLHLTTAGWARYAVGPRGRPVLLESGPWAYETRGGAPTVPALLVELPLRRPVGYLLARKACAIFNQESARDNLIRTGNFPLLNVVGNDKTFKAVVAALKEGSRALQNLPSATQHAFIAPDTGPAAIAGQILERKVLEFYRSGFKEYEEVARDRVTATEVKAKQAGGVFAFLTMLSAAVEDAENQALWLLEQTFFPRDRTRWGTASIARSTDFVPLDVNEVVERLAKRYHGDGKRVPVGRAGRIAASLEIARWDGIAVDEAEVAADVDRVALLEALDLTRELPIPAEAKAEMAVRFLAGTGFVDAKATVPLADGSAVPLLDVLRVRALALAKAGEDVALAGARANFGLGGNDDGTRSGARADGGRADEAGAEARRRGPAPPDA